MASAMDRELQHDKTKKVPMLPKQSWWGHVYCERDLACGNSGFAWEVSDSELESHQPDGETQEQGSELDCTNEACFIIVIFLGSGANWL